MDTAALPDTLTAADWFALRVLDEHSTFPLSRLGDVLVVDPARPVTEGALVVYQSLSDSAPCVGVAKTDKWHDTLSVHSVPQPVDPSELRGVVIGRLSGDEYESFEHRWEYRPCRPTVPTLSRRDGEQARAVFSRLGDAKKAAALVECAGDGEE
ncbi:MAG: hypothetical protein HY329_18470 [Chloroflexi bacterium]|nr:hypothetical protein [Chloroflexota bacterium]